MTTRSSLMLPAMALAVAGVAFAPDTASAESTWDQIHRAGVIRSGMMDAPPYFWRHEGKWIGAMVNMSEDIGKNLGLKVEHVDVGGWGQTVLNLTGNKTDMQFSLQATPVRAKAIDFAGPAYYIAFITINSPTFKGKTWADYNKPEVKVAVELGSANETILRKQAPRATVLGFTQMSEGLMAVKSGRADAFTTTTMAGLVGKTANPDLGEFVVPPPVVQLPGYIGVRQDVGDTRFRDFLKWWSEWNVLLGNSEKWLKEALQERGIQEIPETVHF